MGITRRGRTPGASESTRSRSQSTIRSSKSTKDAVDNNSAKMDNKRRNRSKSRSKSRGRQRKLSDGNIESKAERALKLKAVIESKSEKELRMKTKSRFKQKGLCMQPRHFLQAIIFIVSVFALVSLPFQRDYEQYPISLQRFWISNCAIWAGWFFFVQECVRREWFVKDAKDIIWIDGQPFWAMLSGGLRHFPLHLCSFLIWSRFAESGKTIAEVSRFTWGTHVPEGHHLMIHSSDYMYVE